MVDITLGVSGVLATNVPIRCAAPAGVDKAPMILHALDLPVPAHVGFEILKPR